jgi:hypothetical protein
MLRMNSSSSAFERGGSWTAAALAVALAAFVVELLWFERLLPMTSDHGQVLMGALIIAWLVVSLVALWKRPSWALLVGVPLALFAPILVLGGLTLSCALVGDCP